MTRFGATVTTNKDVEAFLGRNKAETGSSVSASKESNSPHGVLLLVLSLCTFSDTPRNCRLDLMWRTYTLVPVL